MIATENVNTNIVEDKKEAEMLEMDTQQLTKFADQDAVEHEETEPESTLSFEPLIKSLADQGQQQMLSRPYQIGSFQWSTSQGVGANLAHFRFPDDLFQFSQIKDRIDRFEYFHTKAIKIEIRTNATLQHQGALCVSYVRGQYRNHDQENTSVPFTSNVVQRFNNDPMIISAQQTQIPSIELEWDLPVLMMNHSQFTEMSIAEVWIDVLSALRGTITGILPITLTVWASFVDPWVAMPKWKADPEAEYEANPMVHVVGESKRRKPETEDKSENSSLISMFKDIDVPAILDTVGTLAEIVPPALAIFGLDKPTATQAAMSVNNYPMRDIQFGAGLDTSIRLAYDPEATTASPAAVMGDYHNPTISQIIQVPAYLTQRVIPYSGQAGDRLLSIPVVPTLSGTFGTSPTRLIPTYMAHYSQFFQMWRGSIKFQFRFFLSKFLSCRLRLRWVRYYDPDTTGNPGDLYNQVIDIENGDTVVNVTVPWVSDKLYERIPDRFLYASVQGASYVNYPMLILELVNPIQSADPNGASDIGYAVYCAAGADMQFNFYNGSPKANREYPVIQGESRIREEFKNEEAFVPLADYRPSVEANYCSPEQYGDIVSMAKRFEPIPASGSTLSKPANGLFRPGSLAGFLFAPFMWAKGSVRYKIVYEFENPKHIYSNLENSFAPRSQNPSMSSAYTEFEIPFYAPVYKSWAPVFSTLSTPAEYENYGHAPS